MAGGQQGSGCKSPQPHQTQTNVTSTPALSAIARDLPETPPVALEPRWVDGGAGLEGLSANFKTTVSAARSRGDKGRHLWRGVR